MPVIDIDHVQIAAPPNCESKAREFFGVLLGLQEIEKPEALAGRGGCWFKSALANFMSALSRISGRPIRHIQRLGWTLLRSCSGHWIEQEFGATGTQP